MDVRDFKIMADIVKKDTYKAYEKEKEKWENEIHIDKFLVEKKITSEAFECQSRPVEMIYMLNDFINVVDNLPYHQNGRVALALSAYSQGYDEGCAIDDNHYECTYNVLCSEEDVALIIKNDLSKKFKEILKTKGTRYAKDVGCRLMELYMDETISFKTLQGLVYADCER